MLIKCEGVVLYRSSPAQKAQVVELMRKFDPSKKTLAVGDGINVIKSFPQQYLMIVLQQPKPHKEHVIALFSPE